MALSSAELLQLQQSLTQLARASSNIAQFATQLGNVQSQNASTQQTETKHRRTVIDDYANLSDALKKQSKEYKDTLKNIQGFTQNLDNVNRRQKLASTALDALNASIAAAGSATAAQTLRQTLLTRVLATVEAEKEAERAKIASQNERVSDAIIGIISDSKDAMRYRGAYEKDFYGRQLASEVRSALDTIASTTGAKFGKQLLEFADIEKLGKFTDMQEKVVKSLLDNNQTINDSNAEAIQQYLKLGKSIGFTSTEFDNLATRMDSWTAGTNISLSADSITSLVDATSDIAKVINDSNEKLSQTIDRDLKSFGGQFKAYQFENRSGFEKLIDELSDINKRHGSLTTGPGRDEAADALHSAVGMLGREVIPKMAAMLATMGNYYTKEYDALTNFVQTNRLTALQLNMTEEQYRQSRAESKATWNLAAESGQKQLDEFLTSRRRSLEAVYGTEPILRDKMGTQFYNLINLLGMTNGQVDGMIKDFGNLSLTSRMSSVELTELFMNVANSNDNLQLMNSLDAKGRQARIKEINYAVSLASKLGLAGESAVQFSKALADVPTKTVSTAEIVGQLGSAQVMLNMMNNAAERVGVQLNTTAEDLREFAKLKGLKEAGAPLDEQQLSRLTAIGSSIAQDQAEIQTGYLKALEAAKQRGGTAEEYETMKSLNQMRNFIEEFTKAANIGDVVDPIKDQALAMKKYNQTQGTLITSTDELKRAMDLQNEYAKRRAEEIKTAKTITGAAAEANRFVEGAQGNMWTDLATNAGGGVIAAGVLRAAPAIAGILGPMLAPIMASVSGMLLPALGVLAVGGAGYAAYKALTSEESPETPNRIEPATEEPNQNVQLPSSQVSAAESSAAATALNDQFTKYFSSVEAQNALIAGFLRTMSDNSTGLSKDIKEWRDLYEFIHPKVPMEEESKDKKNKDPSTMK